MSREKPHCFLRKTSLCPRSLVARDPHSGEANLSQMASFDCTSILTLRLTVVKCLSNRYCCLKPMSLEITIKPSTTTSSSLFFNYNKSNRMYFRQNQPYRSNSFPKWRLAFVLRSLYSGLVQVTRHDSIYSANCTCAGCSYLWLLLARSMLTRAFFFYIPSNEASLQVKILHFISISSNFCNRLIRNVTIRSN